MLMTVTTIGKWGRSRQEKILKVEAVKLIAIGCENNEMRELLICLQGTAISISFKKNPTPNKINKLSWTNKTK